jgi:HPt (histidine-containing phosphotransfer) domain-containing protein
MIDTAHLDTLTQLLGRDTINQIRLEYIEDSHEKLAQLLQAWDTKDYSELRQVSHSLKSASLNMAMSVFAKQCQQIEQSASQHNEQGMQAIIDTLPSLHTLSLRALNEYFSDFD